MLELQFEVLTECAGCGRARELDDGTPIVVGVTQLVLATGVRCPQCGDRRVRVRPRFTGAP